MSGLDNTAYLKMRVAKLNEYERTCLLMIDEIYIVINAWNIAVGRF